MWLLGDKFIHDNAQTYIRENKNNPANYVFNNFEVEFFGANDLESNNASRLGHFRNALFHAFNRYQRLPKLIVYIIEDDLLHTTNFNDFGLTEVYEEMMSWLVVHRSVLTIKEKLPSRSLKEGWPHVLFVAPSVHRLYRNDNKRRKFTAAMEKAFKRSPANSHNMSILRLKHIWDPEDSSYFIPHRNILSVKGIETYWSSVERVICYCINKMEDEKDRIRMENINWMRASSVNKGQNQQYKKMQESNRFHHKKNDKYHYYKL